MCLSKDSKRLSLNGVAVVDAGGKLVDVISTFDLRGILPVRLYLHTIVPNSICNDFMP